MREFYFYFSHFISYFMFLLLFYFISYFYTSLLFLTFSILEMGHLYDHDMNYSVEDIF